MTSISGCAQSKSTNTIVSKDSLIGKTYEAKVEEIFGKMLGGGFSDTKYCYLRFEKDSVEITLRQIHESSVYGEVTESDKSESKTCQWQLQNEEIIIENFNDYGQLIFISDQIIGKDRFGNKLIFNTIEARMDEHKNEREDL
jgi:hypothetical protein